MKKLGLLCFILLVATAVNVFGASIHSYQELASAMRTGERFVILLDLPECTGKPNMPLGYFIPSKIMLVPESDSGPERIATSDLHFTDHRGSPTYEYVKYTFNSDDTVIIRTAVYDAPTFKPVGNAHTIYGTLNKGVSVYTSTDQVVRDMKEEKN